MTHEELYALLKSTGLPVAYHHFTGTPDASVPSPPYIVYLEDGSDAWGSDDQNGIKRTGYLVELYANKKDPESQEKIEALFNARGIGFSCIETYISTEKLYQAAYTIEFVSKI